jgi:probable F420-dependent oxidoreductase
VISHRVGVWLGGFGPPAVADKYTIGEIESLGYGALWFGEAPGGRDPFTRAAMLLDATETITVGTGIASIWLRSAAAMGAAAATLGEAFPGRFVMGVGVSHGPVVNQQGFSYEHPLATMRTYLAEMNALSHRFEVGPEAVPLVVAALRPKMLELAGRSADGAHPYFVPVEHTARAREILGPDKLLVPELAVVLDDDRHDARAKAREHVAGFYLEAESYVANLRWLGWADEDLEHGGSDRLVDAIVAWGDEQAIRDRVAAHLAAGADQVLIQPIVGFDPGDQIEQLRRLAPALEGV